MENDYQIRYVDEPDDAVWTAVGGGLDKFNTQVAGETSWKRLCFTLSAPDGSIAGGVIAETYWNWLYISLMFVKDELRGQGYGRRLMQMAEDEARQRGAKAVYLDTFSFQAPGFYEKLGYRVYGTLEDFPQGCKRYFMTKDL